MSYKDIEIDDEELLAPIQNEFHFTITDAEARKFLESLVNTYRQFSKFPRSHRSFKSLQHTGAMYEYILKRFNNP